VGLIIWRSLLHRKLPNIALIVSIAVGVAIMFSVAVIYHGAADGMELFRQRMGADIVVVHGGVTVEPNLLLFGGAAVNTYMPANVLASVRDVPGVSRATPQFFTHTLAGASCCDIGTETRLIGYDPKSDWIVGPWLKTDNPQIPPGGVIVGAKVDTVGDTMTIMGKPFAVTAVAAESGSSLDYSLLINIDEARQLAGESYWLSDIWKKHGSPDGLISAVLIQVDPAADSRGGGGVATDWFAAGDRGRRRQEKDHRPVRRSRAAAGGPRPADGSGCHISAVFPLLRVRPANGRRNGAFTWRWARRAAQWRAPLSASGCRDTGRRVGRSIARLVYVRGHA
jgi:hypothetical protein